MSKKKITSNVRIYSSSAVRKLKSRTNWDAAKKKDDSALDDGLPADFWETAVVTNPPRKQAISLRVDTDLLDWYKEQASSTDRKMGYQTLMHQVLASHRAGTAPFFQSDSL